MIKHPEEITWFVHYANQVHHVRHSHAVGAVAALVPTYPELNQLANVKFTADENNHVFVELLTPAKKKASREELQSMIDEKQKPNFDMLVSTKPLPLRSPYEAMLSIEAELFLDESIRVKREEMLRALIEDALTRRDEDAFMRYTTELKELPKYVTMASKGNG